jgi:hypothetical protein
MVQRIPVPQSCMRTLHILGGMPPVPLLLAWLLPLLLWLLVVATIELLPAPAPPMPPLKLKDG